MTPDEKNRIVKKARKAGMKTSQFMRLAAEQYQPGEDEEALAAMIEQMNRLTEHASRAIDEALEFVEASNQRIAEMERAAGDRQ
jgi:hypothetical protein